MKFYMKYSVPKLNGRLVGNYILNKKAERAVRFYTYF